MSTFTKDGDPKISKKDAAPIPDDKDKPETPFDKLVKGWNEDYVERCKKMAQEKEFTIMIREGNEDVEHKYHRKHLTQGQLDEIEDLRATAQELTENDKGSKAQRQANTDWYSRIASYVLYDGVRRKFMDETEFKNAVNKDIKPILDGCIMAEMAGVPN
jgi:hypothetical protein